jgi:pyruvate dehydrogenase E2 component (dihydrolipoamide acetyltransferase)
MPSVLAGAEEGTVAAWLVAEGDTIAVGDTIAEIETDKASVEYQAESAGIVGRILAQTGTAIPVGEPIIVLVEPGEDPAEALAGEGPGASAVAEPDDAAPAPAVTAPDPAQQSPSGAEGSRPQPAPSGAGAAGAEAARIFASPVARMVARQGGLDVAALTGSGPNGRFTRRDVEAALRAARTAPIAPETSAAQVAHEHAASPEAVLGRPAPAPYDAGEATLVPHTAMRRTIARRLTLSQSTIPHFQLVADCLVDDLLALRASINAERDGRPLSVNDFVIKAVAGALGDVPEANVTWRDDGMLHHTRADVAVAVATEGGLITPVVRDAGARSVSDISRSVVDLAEKARDKRLTQEEIDGGTFTVSNLGMFGTLGFSAIVNPPHWGILAVGAAKKQPVVAEGSLAIATVMRCTLSVDHRAVDGALAAKWMAAFQRRVEKPLLIVA